MNKIVISLVIVAILVIVLEFSGDVKYNTSPLLTFFISEHSAVDPGFMPGYDFPVSDFQSRWYSKHIRALGEPDLKLVNGLDDERYRFTCLPTFEKPYCIRLDFTDKTAGKIIGKVSSGAGGYDPGSLETSRVGILSSKEVEYLRKKIYEMGYWNMPIEKIKTGALVDPRYGACDGTVLIVEGVSRGEYHFIHRLNVEESSPLNLLKCYLVERAGLEF